MGRNNHGQLATGTLTNEQIFVRVHDARFSSNVESVTCGACHSIFLTRMNVCY